MKITDVEYCGKTYAVVHTDLKHLAIYVYSDSSVEIQIEDGHGGVYFDAGVLRQLADIADEMVAKNEA